MSMYMYNGKTKFNREQLIFIVEAALTAAFDRIECVFTADLSEYEFKMQEKRINIWIDGAKETAGLTIAIFYAQLCDDGLAVGDALEVSGMNEAVSKFLDIKVKEIKEAEEKREFPPDCRPMAEKFVNEMFNEYLK